jgi:D-alanyl-D-alanine carboxypeptidase
MSLAASSYVLLITICLQVAAAMAVGQETTLTESANPSMSGPYFGQDPPGMQPRLFAPGVLPVDGVQHCFPAFSPDGREVYWMQVEFENDRPRGRIMYLKEIDGSWGKPGLAPFSRDFNNHAPVFSFDGQRLYFSSDRSGGVGPGKNIWYVERTESGWGEPKNLGSPPNSDLSATQATFTRDGTVYFTGMREGTQWNTGIYRSRFIDGQYLKAEPLGAPISTPHADIYPYIAPDESYLLFGSTRPGSRSIESDLYISFRDSDDTWSQPIQLDESINNGRSVSFSFVTHDGKYLFFNRFDEDGTDKFYWVDASIIDDYRERSTLHANLQAVLDKYQPELDIIGISAAVVWEDGRFWTGASGQSSRDVAISEDMLFGIGSVTKTYVAALILKYDELGLLHLDDTIGDWLADIPFVDSRISVRQLLNHTSGLYNYMAHPEYNNALYAYPDTVWTALTLLDSFMDEPDSEPGQKWEYSAANYLLLGMIVERISGKSAGEEIHTRILTPLGFENTFLYPQELYDTGLMAHLWMVVDSTGTPMDLNLLVSHPPLSGLFSSVWTAGAMHATALDAAKWLAALFSGKVLSPSSISEMTRPVPESGTIQYGLGIVNEEIGGVQSLGHSGGIGYSSIVVYFPQDRISISVLCNSETDPRSITSGLYKIVAAGSRSTDEADLHHSLENE